MLDGARTLLTQVQADPMAVAHAQRCTEQLAAARRAGSAEAQVLVLRAQAYVEGSRYADTRAKALLDRAVRLARQHGLDRQLVAALLSRSGVTAELGRLAAAQRDLDAVRALLNQDERPDFHLQQAALFHNAGQLSGAARMYRLALADPQASSVTRAMTANNLGSIEVQLGRPDAALAHLDLATELAATCSPPIRAGVATTRSWVAMQAGRLTDSLRQFDEAGRLYLAAGLPLGSHYLEYVDALIELRLLPEARALTDRAVEELDRSGVALMSAEGQVRRARLALLQGDPSTAVVAAELAAAQFARQHRPDWAAQAATIAVDGQTQLGTVSTRSLGRIRRAASTFERLALRGRAVDAHLIAGRAALALQRPTVATEHFRRARNCAGTNPPVLLRLRSNLAGALDGSLRGQPAAVLRHCRAGLTDLARHRDAFASLELRVLASGHGAELGRLGLAALVRTGSPAQVFQWLERTRAAALVAVQPVSTVGIDDALGELRAVQAELAALEVAEQARTEADHSRSVTLLGRQAQIEQQIRRATWIADGNGRVAGTGPSPAELRRRLGGRTLVEFGVLDGDLLAVVLGPRRTRVVPLGALADAERHIDLLLFGLRRLSQPGRSAPAAAAARAGTTAALAGLRATLLDGLALPPGNPLVIIPPAALQRVPWSALWSAPVTLAPSASFWLTSGERVAASDRVVLVAGPHLPGATAEVQALQRLHPGCTVLEPPASTVGAVTAALAQAGLAHLACHGRLRSDNPSFSALQLSDGSLTVHELDVRGIAPHRMVLASCNSAADMSFAGNEVLGFVSTLMTRGTSGLAASIVVIPDATSAPLMQALHARLLAGDRLADALWSARGTVDTSDAPTFVGWCAFNAYGAA